MAFESERERNAAIMLARRFAFDCNVCVSQSSFKIWLILKFRTKFSFKLDCLKCVKITFYIKNTCDKLMFDLIQFERKFCPLYNLYSSLFFPSYVTDCKLIKSQIMLAGPDDRAPLGT